MAGREGGDMAGREGGDISGAQGSGDNQCMVWRRSRHTRKQPTGRVDESEVTTGGG